MDGELADRERLLLHEPAAFRPGYRSGSGALISQSRLCDPRGVGDSGAAGSRPFEPSQSSVPPSAPRRQSPIDTPPAHLPSSISLSVPRARRGLVAAAAAALAVCTTLLWVPQDGSEQVAIEAASIVPRPTGPRSISAVQPSAPTRAKPVANVKTLAWAPAKGAVGYEVQLFRGSQRVLLVRTRDSRLDLHTTWPYEGRLIRRRPGTYRWYVWPLFQGNRRASPAIVQARVVLASGA